MDIQAGLNPLSPALDIFPSKYIKYIYVNILYAID